MKTMRTTTLTLLFSAMMTSITAHATGVPTIDAANMGQMMIQFERLGEQLKAQETTRDAQIDTLGQVTQTAENFIGQIDYYRDLINNISFRKTANGYIPENVSEVLAIIKDGAGSSNPEIAKIIDEIMASSPALEELTDARRKEVLEQSRREMAYYQAAYQQAYNAASERQKMALELAEKSGEVSNEKEARALALAMQSEELIATNDLARMLAMEQMKQQQAEVEAQDKKEMSELIKQNRRNFFNERLGISNK